MSRRRFHSRPRRSRVVLVATGLVAALVVPAISATPASAGPGDISTVAGGGDPPDGLGDGLPAAQASLRAPWGVDEASGTLFISEVARGLVRKVEGGIITTFAGGATLPLGDGRPATGATLNFPEGVAVGTGGHLFIADEANNRIRRVDATTGIITTVAGIGTGGFNGDGIPATSAQLSLPLRVAFDRVGAMLISDQDNFRVRRVSPGPDGRVNGGPGELITTVAGDGTPGSGGDGGPATAAQFFPRGIAVNPSSGDVYVADVGDSRVRRVLTGGDGVVDGGPGELIGTYVGGGELPPGGAGEGAPADQVTLGAPEALTTDSAGNLFVSTVGDYRVAGVDTAQIFRTVAGNGNFDFAGSTGKGDGGPATAAEIAFGFGLSVDAANILYIGEISSSRVRKVVPGPDGMLNGGPGEIISTYAGDGTFAFGGDGGPATQAQLNRAADVVAASGSVFIADASNNRVRKVDAAGVITTVAGGFIGDGSAATSAVVSQPRGVVADGAGGVLIAECGNQRVRRVDASGTISTYVGGLVPFRCPSGLHLVTSGPGAGVLYVADAGSHRVFRVAPGGGGFTVVAGTGTAGFTGDGVGATTTRLNSPSGVHVDAGGNVLVADTANSRVRRVDAATGRISTVAGNGTFAIGTDGGPASRTPVAAPTDMAPDPAGNLVIAESGFHRLRRVNPGGAISTIAGSGIPSFGGDGGPAGSASLTFPTQLDLDGTGNLFFTDRGNGRVRRIESGNPAPPPLGGCGQVITRNTVLTANVGPCAGDGVVIAADNVSLDLRGFSISGTDGSTDNVGVRIAARRGVVIRSSVPSRARGAIRGFDAGVAIIGGSNNLVQDLKIRDNLGTTDDTATFGDGIGIFFSSDNRILNNVVDNNGVFDGIGVLGINSHRNVVQGNTVTRTRSLDVRGPTGIGIILNSFLSEDLPREQSIVGNKVVGNTVRDNDNSGISNISSINASITGNVVETNGRDPGAIPANGIGVQALIFAEVNTNVVVQGNRVVGNGIDSALGDGIHVASNRNQIVANQVHGNYASGIVIEGGPTTGQANEIRNNDAANNVLEPGFGIADLSDLSLNFDTFVFDCDHNNWVGNIWGTGGFFPDPALTGEEGPVACTTKGGHPAGPSPTAAAEGPTAAAEGPTGARPQSTPRSSTLDYRDLARGHPAMP